MLRTDYLEGITPFKYNITPTTTGKLFMVDHGV